MDDPFIRNIHGAVDSHGSANDVCSGKKRKGMVKIVSAFQGSDDAYKSLKSMHELGKCKMQMRLFDVCKCLY